MKIDRDYFENDWKNKFIYLNKRKPKHEEVMAFRTGFNAGVDFRDYEEQKDEED